MILILLDTASVGITKAEIIMTTANVALAVLALVTCGYQIVQDRKREKETAKLHKQNIQLQWFKELIIQPNLSVIKDFYINMYSLQTTMKQYPNNLSDGQKKLLIKFVADNYATLRRSFVNILFSADATLSIEIKKNLVALVDNIITTIPKHSQILNLNNSKIYREHIESKIISSHQNLISLLFKYEGIKEK